MNQSLVDDGLVDKEKIGGSNYFWSFPAKKDRQNELSHSSTLTRIEGLKSSMLSAEARLADAKRGREECESGERSAKMARRAELSAELARSRSELDRLKENDPREIANLERELKLVTDAAHRWTDNIFSCKDYLVKKRGMMKKEGERDPRLRAQSFVFFIYTLCCSSHTNAANKYLGITDNFDCKSKVYEIVGIALLGNAEGVFLMVQNSLAFPLDSHFTSQTPRTRFLKNDATTLVCTYKRKQHGRRGHVPNVWMI